MLSTDLPMITSRCISILVGVLWKLSKSSLHIHKITRWKANVVSGNNIVNHVSNIIKYIFYSGPARLGEYVGDAGQHLLCGSLRSRPSTHSDVVGGNTNGRHRNYETDKPSPAKSKSELFLSQVCLINIESTCDVIQDLILKVVFATVCIQTLFSFVRYRNNIKTFKPYLWPWNILKHLNMYFYRNMCG